MDTIEDNKQRLQNLISFSQRRREWYQDLNIKIADRQSGQISLLSSISAAILAITSTLSIERTVWVELSFWSLLVTVALGIFLLFWLISFDNKVVTKDRIVESDILNKLKNSTREAIDKYPEYQSQHVADFKLETEKIEKLTFDEHKTEKKMLTIFYYIILASFLLGMFGLAAAWLEKGGVIINMNVFTMVLALIVSIGLGYIKFGTLKQPKKDNWNWQQKFAEIWNCSINFFIASLVAYYFVIVRWPFIASGNNPTVADFILLLVFGMGMFGHLNVLSLNLTEGVEAIISRFMKGKKVV